MALVESGVASEAIWRLSSWTNASAPPTFNNMSCNNESHPDTSLWELLDYPNGINDVPQASMVAPFMRLPPEIGPDCTTWIGYGEWSKALDTKSSIGIYALNYQRHEDFVVYSLHSSEHRIC